MEKAGITNTLEIVAALKELAIVAKQIAKDGIDLTDLPTLMVLLQKQAVFTAAIDGAKEVVTESKDLSVDEVGLLVAAVLSAIKEVKAA